MSAAPPEPRPAALLTTAPDAPPAPATRRARHGRRGWLLAFAILILAALALIGWNAAQLGATGLSVLAARSWLDLAPALLRIPGLDALAPQAAPWLDALPWLVWLALGTVCALALARPSRPSPRVPPAAASVGAFGERPASPGATPILPAPGNPDSSVLPTAPTPPPTGLPVEFNSTALPATASPSATDPTRPAAPPRRVFISHSAGDNPFGTDLVARLRAEGIDAWYDSYGGPDAAGAWQGSIPPATYWQDEIVGELTTRPIFLVIVTPRAVASPWVHDEIGLAWSEKNSADITRGKIVIPVLRATCAVPPLVSLVQYVDYRPEADQDKAWRDLLYALRANRTIPAPPIELGPPFDLGLLPPLERFVGREDAVRRVMALLTGESLDSVPTPGGVASVAAANGTPGIGKTALATEVVRRLMARNAFPDGAAVVICKDQRDPVALLRRVIARFTPGRREPDDTEIPALADRARQTLGGKRALIALDNIEPDLPLRDVLGPLRAVGAAVLLTSRGELPDVPPEARLKLEVLPVEEALDVFAEYYGRGAALDLTRSELDAARRILTALGRHTLAVKLAAANAATLQRPLATMADEYERDPRRALWLENGEEAVRAVLDSSYVSLSAGGQSFFVALAAFATADVGRQAALAVAAATAAEDVAEAERLERGLREVVTLRMADAALNEAMPEASDRERLRLHPLLQTYARDLLAQRPEREGEAAARAVAAWYADYANETRDEALVPDEANTAGALEWAHEQEEDRLTVRLCVGMQYYWRDRSRTAASLRFLPRGIEAAARIAALSESDDDRLTVARLQLSFATALLTAGQTRRAEEFINASLEISRSVGDTRGEGVALSKLGDILVQRGDLPGAQTNYERVLSIMREVGDRKGEGVALYKLALMAETNDNLDRAEALHRDSLGIGIAINAVQDIADSYAYLGAFLLKYERGKPGEGCEMLHDAARLYDEMGMPGGDEARATARQFGCAVD
ncbi:MAG TPA: TIR domain-containing protein [Ktedonobacterales bacterium]